MAEEPFEAILRGTLKDYRVSRGERRVVRQILDELNADEQQRDFFRHRAFAIAREELADPTAHKVVDWLEEIIKALDHTPVPAKSTEVRSEASFSPGHDCLQTIRALLAGTRRKVDICVFTITDNRISDAIVDCHARGVQVRVITDDDKSGDRGSDIDRLENVGVPVRVDHSPYHMHHKYAIFDDKTLLTGSYNWTRSAAEVNEENIITTGDAALVKQFSGHFAELWKNTK